MSKLSKRKARRRRKPKASREQLIALEVASRAHETRQAEREERKRRRLLEAMRLEAGLASSSNAQLVLPDSAYEASRLMDYVEG
jgi:hypothetical protein